MKGKLYKDVRTNMVYMALEGEQMGQMQVVALNSDKYHSAGDTFFRDFRFLTEELNPFEKTMTLENDPIKEGWNGWIRNKEFGCWTKGECRHQPPSAYALGSKYVYWNIGGSLRGSTTDDWHGQNFGRNLENALIWLKENNSGKTSQWFEQ